MFDPPSGWRYGFPTAIPEDIKTDEQLAAWLRKLKYPESLIPLALKNSRYWEE